MFESGYALICNLTVAMKAWPRQVFYRSYKSRRASRLSGSMKTCNPLAHNFLEYPHAYQVHMKACVLKLRPWSSLLFLVAGLSFRYFSWAPFGSPFH